MAFTNLSERHPAKTLLRPLAECAVLGMAGFAVCSLLWPKPPAVSGFEKGFPAAWLASALSLILLVQARGVSPEAFRRAWGRGIALRASALAALMFLSWGKSPLFASALLLSYVFGLILFLPMEFRHLTRSAQNTSASLGRETSQTRTGTYNAAYKTEPA